MTAKGRWLTASSLPIELTGCSPVHKVASPPGPTPTKCASTSYLTRHDRNHSCPAYFALAVLPFPCVLILQERPLLG